MLNKGNMIRLSAVVLQNVQLIIQKTNKHAQTRVYITKSTRSSILKLINLPTPKQSPVAAAIEKEPLELMFLTQVHSLFFVLDSKTADTSQEKTSPFYQESHGIAWLNAGATTILQDNEI